MKAPPEYEDGTSQGSVTSTATALMTSYGKTPAPVNVAFGSSKTVLFPAVSTYRQSRFSGTSQAPGTSAATAMPASYGKTPAPGSVASGL